MHFRDYEKNTFCVLNEPGGFSFLVYKIDAVPKIQDGRHEADVKNNLLTLKQCLVIPLYIFGYEKLFFGICF